MAEKIQKLTREGYKNLEKKQKYLKGKVRQEIADRIRQAKEFGELSENIEYDNAKSEQARVEQEIMKLDMILRNAQIIERKGSASKEVEVGVAVQTKYQEEDKLVKFEIVGTSESDPMHDPPRISDESPVGAALIGLERGQVAEIETPLGRAHYELIDILPIMDL